jgi:hypothetical protein
MRFSVLRVARAVASKQAPQSPDSLVTPYQNRGTDLAYGFHGVPLEKHPEGIIDSSDLICPQPLIFRKMPISRRVILGIRTKNISCPPTLHALATSSLELIN